ncbi:MAG: EAL domain-containing protein [Lachnospiraceae bacterium]|nr:EAL domain-containing protein [Lachnospiraceae bacterium]
MKKDNDGIIYTKSKCIGCNGCMLGCPVFDANKAIVVNGGTYLVVDSDRCVHCGSCITSCPHGSRDYRDDTDAFLAALNNRENLSVVVAPSFLLRYPEQSGKILNYLKNRGVINIYDGGFGGTLSTWALVNFLENHPEGGFAIAECPVVVNYLEKLSMKGIQHLAPVFSSVMCMGIYIKKHFNDTAKLVFLGNCPARKDEFESPGAEGIYTYNVTYKRLMSRIDASEYEDLPQEVELDCSYPSNMLFAGGDAKDGVAQFIDPDKHVLTVMGGQRFYKYADSFCDNIITSENGPYIADILNCEHGCLMGPADDKNIMEYIRVWERRAGILAKARKGTDEMLVDRAGVSPAKRLDELKKSLNTFLSYLNPADFRRDFSDRYYQQPQIPDAIINEVFDYMHKYKEEERHVNCHSCGYGSCREMAKAIALGINRRENCVYFEKYENQRLYLTDLDTGIPNLNSFNNRTAELMRKHEVSKYAVASFSLMDNDLMYSRYGYDEVNKCIKEYARIAGSMVSGRELIARKGDVEFLTIIEKNKMDDFLLNLNEIVVHPSIGQREEEFVINICAGVYQPTEEDSVGDIIGKASIAHRAARERKSPCCIYYDDSMKDGSVEASFLTKAFSDAIKKREFVVYYQPKVDLRSMKLHGAEALVRWIHNGEFISPGRFIPMFEKNGYVVHVDFFVLDQVCRDLRAWLDAGLKPVRVSTNFSKVHISNLVTRSQRPAGSVGGGTDNDPSHDGPKVFQSSAPELVGQIVDVIDRYDIPHELIEIEFTETTAAGESERLAQVIRDLHEKGISTSIDDFGSGYSSLNLLQTMDFNVLKIDRGFLTAGIKDPKTREIIASVIQMAKALEMQVVAEGVEKYEELEFLRDKGCDMIQGYYFDKPMPGEDYRNRLVSPEYEIREN